jgi:hypothetical protein
MQRLLSALKSFPLAILDVFLKSLLLIVYVLTALPLGLLWRRLKPHPSWVRASTTRWSLPDKSRHPETLEAARRQF